MTEFICSWDKTALIITILTIVIVAVVSVALIVRLTGRYKLKGKNHGLVLSILIIAYLLPVILILPFLYMPTKISVDDKNLIVNQIKGKIEIPINEILEIRAIKTGDLSNNIRTFGSGGLFGYLGKFENPQFGNYQMYVVNKKNLFVLKTQNGKIYVFSCKNPEKLIQVINNQIFN
ncbi:MAG: PH domain-containing protein [Prevotellaceae bacterium]|jgi:hypothetical protein|nr:PH domain-containing protein [Prevotellaceae bacterium]